MKKVTLWHLSKKHDISLDELRTLFVWEWLMKDWARKVFKKPAKELIAAYQSTQTDTVAWWLISRFFQSTLWYLLLWWVSLLWLLAFTNTYFWADVTNEHQSSVIHQIEGIDHNVAIQEEILILPKTWADLSELE